MQLDVFKQLASLTSTVAASGQLHDARPHLYLRIQSGAWCGWAEVSPQPSSINGDAGLSDVIDHLQHHVLPQLIRVTEAEGAVPHWARVARFANATAASRTASTIVEMGLLDWSLRAEGKALSLTWPKHFATPTLRTVSALGPEWSPFDTPISLRLKVDAVPLSDAVLASLQRDATDVLLDYNCCAPSQEAIERHIAQLQGFVPLRALEQPFAPGNVVDHALLRSATGAAVSLDEGVRTRRDIDHIAQYGAADYVCIKPARVGGYSVARSLIEHAKAKGLRPYVGGYFESPLARSVNRALAESFVSEASDIAPAPLTNGGTWIQDETGVGLRPSPELIGTWERLFSMETDLGLT